MRVARRNRLPHASHMELELVERPGVPPTARRPLEHLVGDELHDERTTSQQRSESQRAGSCSSRRRRPHGARHAERAAQRARDEAASDATPTERGTRTAQDRPRRSSRPRRHARARRGSPRARVRGSRGRRRSGGQMPETTTTLTAAGTSPSPAPPRAPRRAGARSPRATRRRTRAWRRAPQPRLRSRPTPPPARRRAGSRRASRGRA